MRRNTRTPSAVLAVVAAVALMSVAAPASAGGKPAKVYKTRDGKTFRDTGKPAIKERRDRQGRLTESVHHVVGEDGKPAIAKTFHQVFGQPAWRPGERASGVSNQLRNLEARGTKRIPKSLGVSGDGMGTSVIMSAARGKNLALIGARKRRPSLRSIARTIAAAADVVGSQQRRSPYSKRQGGFLHQDLKPEHIFVEDINAARPKVTVIDWENMSEAGTAGYAKEITPAFAAPEMWTRTQRTYATDVYALGASMRYMVTGQAFDGRAFDAAFDIDRKNQRAATQFMVDGGSVEEAARRFPTNNLETAIRAELARPYNAPPGLKAIIDKAMSYDPAQRYQTNRAFARALRDWAATRKR
jgi:serine/threonine protein kinase